MATRDYVDSRQKRRAGGRNTKKAAPRRFPVIPVLLIVSLIAGFGSFLYLIKGKGANAPTIEEQVKANKPKAEGNGLPQEKWSYIERLENKQVDIGEPPPQPGVLPPAETEILHPEKLPRPVETKVPQPGTVIGQVQALPSESKVQPAQPVKKVQPVEPGQQVHQVQPLKPVPAKPAPVKPATGAPVANAQEQVIAKAPATDGSRYMMQCAVLRSQDSAESLKARIAFGAGLSSSVQVVNGASGTFYKVMVGPFGGKAAVEAANGTLQGSGVSGCIPKKA